MKREMLKKYIETGREIEFAYKGKMYSITYYGDENKKDYISFCEFYKEPIDVTNFDELCNTCYDGVKVIDMWEALTEDDDYSIY